MSLIEKKRQMLKWLHISDILMKSVFANKYKISKTDLRLTNKNISKSFYDKKVNINIMKDIFDDPTFKHLKKIVDHLRNSSWQCFFAKNKYAL